MSSAAASNPNYGIGYADASDSGNPAGLAAGQIEIMYTLLGDANLDGKVNGSDFNLMATNFNQSVTAGWDKGDFNYDGEVNGDDFVGQLQPQFLGAGDLVRIGRGAVDAPNRRVGFGTGTLRRGSRKIVKTHVF